MPAEIIPIPGFSEPFAAISHLVGLVAFAFVGPALVWRGRARVSHMAVLLVLFGATEFLLAMSMTYHLLEPDSFAREEVLRRLDHAAIFVLIAGTFTAAHGMLFAGWRRWGMIALVWSFVAIAVPVKMVFWDWLPESAGLGLYLGFGWIGVISGVLLYRRHGLRFILPLVAGGVAYSAGAVAEFLRQPRLLPGVMGPHEIFHLAVLLGLGLHWWFMWSIAEDPPEV